MTRNKFKSDILESVHSSAAALLKVGAIDKQTMRQFDERCLVSVPTLLVTDRLTIAAMIRACCIGKRPNACLRFTQSCD